MCPSRRSRLRRLVPFESPRSIYVRKAPHSREASIEAFAAVVDEKVERGVDVILLPEGATVVGTGLSYAESPSRSPGRAPSGSGGWRARKNAYLIFGLYERESTVIYNTAVLLDRQGRVAGKYRKVYLPREEMQAGLTPGDSYPDFRDRLWPHRSHDLLGRAIS
jgi:predicted amidohydrolase